MNAYKYLDFYNWHSKWLKGNSRATWLSKGGKQGLPNMTWESSLSTVDRNSSYPTNGCTNAQAYRVLMCWRTAAVGTRWSPWKPEHNEYNLQKSKYLYPDWVNRHEQLTCMVGQSWTMKLGQIEPVSCVLYILSWDRWANLIADSWMF